MTSTSPQNSPGPVTPAPFARILVGSIPTDQGADARALALALAAACDARVQLVSVIEARWLDHLGEQTGPAAIHRDEHERLTAALERATDQLSTAIGVHRVEHHLELSSSPARGLHDAAVAECADLIVVGSSHRGPVGRVLLGSVGERLLGGAPCAVAVAPHGYASNQPPLQRILVAFEGSPEARLALRAAHALAKRTRATLAAVMVVAPSAPGVAVGEALPLSGLDVVMPPAGTEPLDTIPVAEALKRQEDAARATLDAATAELNDSAIEPQVLIGPDAAATILDLARDQADLLVLGSRSYGPLRRALLGSVSSHVLRHAPCPVLVMPRARDPDQVEPAEAT